MPSSYDNHRWTVEHAPRLGYHVMKDDDERALIDGEEFTQDLGRAQEVVRELNGQKVGEEDDY